MCLIAFRWNPGAQVPLLIAANRDEYYERPTAPLAWWEGGRILAGRDLQAGGTWMGVNSEGRCAAITNFRDPRLTKPDRASRGQLPVRFLEGSGKARGFLEGLRDESDRFNPFNLLLCDGRDLLGYQSRDRQVVSFAPGLHAVSNGNFDEAWPKVDRILAGLAGSPDDADSLLALLEDAQLAPDERLPKTGIPLEWERALSPVFVRAPGYGTRASTILWLGVDGVSIVEQRFTSDGPEARTDYTFKRPCLEGRG
jgi:uncharacterized protein with NRDE domain